MTAIVPSVRTIPTTYRGTRFRSKLEARWAATFDSLGWYWEYEPAAVDFGEGLRYLCDFRLPAQRCWVEVKGPVNDRLDKTNRLHKATPHDLIVIGRPAGPGGLVSWHGTDTSNVGIFTCRECLQTCFCQPLRERHNRKPVADWRCRCCHTRDALDPASRISSAATIEAHRRDQGTSYTDTFLTGLPLAHLPQGAAR